MHRGTDKAVTLRNARLLRRGDADALEAEAGELTRQLASNAALDAADRAELERRLQQLRVRAAV